MNKVTTTTIPMMTTDNTSLEIQDYLERGEFAWSMSSATALRSYSVVIICKIVPLLSFTKIGFKKLMEIDIFLDYNGICLSNLFDNYYGEGLSYYSRAEIWPSSDLNSPSGMAISLRDTVVWMLILYEVSLILSASHVYWSGVRPFRDILTICLIWVVSISALRLKVRIP